jgi:hypothetical protein
LAQAKATGATSTYQARAGILFDFCFGLPAKFRPHDDPTPPAKPKPTKDDYIHDGLGKLVASDLKRLHVDTWLQRHPEWRGGRRTKIQAVLRALNYGVESQMIPANPIKGYRTAKANARVTYLTPEQESALCDAAQPVVAQAIKVCIRTGAQPGCEFAKLTAAHVRDYGDRMEWIFQPHESKTKRLCIIRITDQQIMEIIRAQIKQFSTGPIFRNDGNVPWTRMRLSSRFRTVKRRLERHGMEFDADCCLVLVPAHVC